MNKLKRFEGSQNDLAVSLWGTREGVGIMQHLGGCGTAPLSCKDGLRVGKCKLL